MWKHAVVGVVVLEQALRSQVEERRLDDDGYLWFAGRLDDMFKVKGATVYPTEVESALRSIPGVKQAFVTDVVAANGAREVAALVVAATGHARA